MKHFTNIFKTLKMKYFGISLAFLVSSFFIKQKTIYCNSLNITICTKKMLHNFLGMGFFVSSLRHFVCFHLSPRHLIILNKFGKKNRH